MVSRSDKPCRTFRSFRFVIALIVGWISVPQGVWAQQPPCYGCTADSQPHPLSWCYISSYNDYNSGFVPYYILETDPQTAVDHACQAFADGHWLELISGCVLQNPPIAYGNSGAPWGGISYTATFINPRNGELFAGSKSGPSCGCNDSLNSNNVGLGTDGYCHCKNGLQWDGQKQACVTLPCPVDALSPLPPDDYCAQSLEAGQGKDVYGACSVALTPAMEQEAKCLVDKAAAVKITIPAPSSTIRTAGYQAHLRKVWDSWNTLKRLMVDPTISQACAARWEEIDAEKRHHGIVRSPSRKKKSRHEDGNAIDIDSDVASKLISLATTDRSDLEEYIRSPYTPPRACNLRWGGRFSDYDYVHFELSQ